MKKCRLFPVSKGPRLLLRPAIRGTLIFILLPSLLQADLDVAVSPGKPLDWLGEYPFRIAQPERGKVPILTGPDIKSGKKKRSGGRTVPYIPPRAAKKSFVIPVVQDPMSFARIITVDVTNHIPWVNPRYSQSLIRWEEPSKYGLRLRYPPVVEEDGHWFVMGILLRQLLHPARVSLLETRSLFCRLGPVCALPLSQARQVGKLGNVIAQVLEVVKGIPQVPPLLRTKNKQGTFLGMAEKLAICELATSFGYSIKHVFCPRSRSLGEEALPAYAALIAHPHRLVRINAVLLISSFRSPLALEALLYGARSKDPVVAARSLYELGDWKDPKVLKVATSALRNSLLFPIAIEVLGNVGGEEAASIIYRTMRSSSNPEVLFTAVPALGRCGVKKPQYIAFLKSLIKRSGSLFGREEVFGPFTPDRPDPQSLKGDIVAQFAMISLARLGDQKAVQHVQDLAKIIEGQKDGIGPRGGLSQDPLYPVLGPCTYFFLETLAELGPLGASGLKRIISLPGIDRYVRMRAVLEYGRSQWADSEFLKSLCQNAPEPVIRAASLMALSFHYMEKAREAALGLLEGFTKGSPEFTSGADLLVALRIIGRTGGAELKLLLGCLNRATAVSHPHVQQIPRRRFPRFGRGGIASRRIEFIPDVIPYILLEIGRTGEEEAVPILADYLKDDASQGAPEAALALGAIGGPQAAQLLLNALKSKRAWLRYCAFLGLQAIGGKRDFQDWIFSDQAKRDKWHEEWSSWFQKFRSEYKRKAKRVQAVRPEKKIEKPKKAPPALKPKEEKKEQGIEAVLGKLREACFQGNDLLSARLYARIKALGYRSVPFLIEEIEKPYFPTLFVDLLEEITSKRFGLNVKAWKEWWLKEGRKKPKKS